MPRFLARNPDAFTRAVFAGGVALAGAAVLGTAVAATAFTAQRRRRRERLFGKTVVVTGSSRGLGLALAEEFGRLGARVALTARDGEELQRARDLLLRIDAFTDPDDLMVVEADLRKPEDAEYLIHRVSEAWGDIDILVNNAGVITVGPVENQSTQDFHDVMDSNFFTALHCTMAVLPKMLKRHSGVLVNITSIGGKMAVPHLLPYSASKFAAVGFSEGLHVELRGKGIHVLTVCPGLMRTGSHVNALFTGDVEGEYRWFSLGATTPLVSASARSAARSIVRGVLARRTELFITPQAAIAGRFAQVSPEATALVLRAMNRMLPKPAADTRQPVRGAQVRGKEPVTATVIGWDAARRYNELGGTAGVR